MSILLSKIDALCTGHARRADISSDLIIGVADLVLALRSHLNDIEQIEKDFEVAAAALAFFSAMRDKAEFLRLLSLSIDWADSDGSKLYRVATQFHNLWLLLYNSESPLEQDVLVTELTKRFGDEYVSALMTKLASRNMTWSMKAG